MIQLITYEKISGSYLIQDSCLRDLKRIKSLDYLNLYLAYGIYDTYESKFINPYRPIIWYYKTIFNNWGYERFTKELACAKKFQSYNQFITQSVLGFTQ